MNKLPHCIKPCKSCPFTKTCLPGWLGEDRANEILSQDSFVCHKTIHGKQSDRLQCAGHMILLKEENIFYNTAKELDIDLGLKDLESVFETKEQFVQHHKK